MRTTLEQLEAIERLRSFLTVCQFTSVVGIETKPAAGEAFDRLLDLTPDQIEDEFGNSQAFREHIRRKLAEQRYAAFRQEYAPPAEVSAHNDELGEQLVEPLADDDLPELADDETRITDAVAAVEASIAEAELAALLADDSVFDGFDVEHVRPFGA